MENKRVFLHRKLSDLLKKEIKEGKYKPGEYIPSERELSESYSLSRPTVRRAISQLVREGWLYSVAGTGTLVSENISLKEKQTRRKSKNIALMLKLPQSPLDSPYYSKIFRSIQEEIANRGYYFSFYSFVDESKVDILKIARERNHAGFIFIGAIKEKIVRQAYKNRIPFVLVDNYMSNKYITSIVSDNRKGAFEATSYLTKLGHKKIYFFGRELDDGVAIERFAGYKDALAEANIPYEKEFFIKDHFTVADGYRTMKNLLKTKRLPTAIFAINDETAIGVMRAISEENNLKIPKDISVIGFDDIDWAAYANPPLTTIKIQKEEIGILAVKSLVERIESKDFINVKTVTPVELVIRSSCSRPSP